MVSTLGYKVVNAWNYLHHLFTSFVDDIQFIDDSSTDLHLCPTCLRGNRYALMCPNVVSFLRMKYYRVPTIKTGDHGRLTLKSASVSSCILHSSTYRRGLLLETGKSPLHLFLLTLILTLRLQEALMLFWFIHFTLLLLLMQGLHNYWVVRRWSKASLADKTLCSVQ